MRNRMDLDDERVFLSRVPLIVLGLVMVVGLIVVLVWFQPQKLVQDTRVDEAAPAPAETVSKDEGAPPRGGSFSGIDHETSGTATLSLADDGKYYVRLEDFATENGPDLVLYLSTAPSTATGREYADDFVDLGPLKGNIGNQNYVVPGDIDLDKYRSVVIWCRRFTTPFGAAPLDPG